MKNPFREDVVYKQKDGVYGYCFCKFKGVKRSINNPDIYAGFIITFQNSNYNNNLYTLTEYINFHESDIERFIPHAIEIRGAYYKIL